MLYWGSVEGTGDPVFVMNIELVCVQVIIGTKGEQGSQQCLKSLMSASAPNSSIVKVRSVSCHRWALRNNGLLRPNVSQQ